MSDCSLSYLASPEFMILASHCLAGIQLPVFLFGGYCIIFKTPPHMITVKWVLLNSHIWTSISDFIITFLGIPYLFCPALAGYGLGVINSPALAIYLLVTIMAFSGVSMIAIYENRYFHLFGRKTWWRHFRKPYFIAMHIMVPFIFVAPYFKIPDQESARIQVMESIPCLPKLTFEDRNMFILSLDYLVPVICVICAVVIMLISFSTFLLLTFWKIWIEGVWAASRQTIGLQKSFTKGVTIQTIYEFLILFIPVVTVLTLIIIWYHSQAINNICMLTLSLNGVGSTIIMLFAHKPYRTFTLSLFCPKALVKPKNENTQWKMQLSVIS